MVKLKHFLSPVAIEKFLVLKMMSSPVDEQYNEVCTHQHAITGICVMEKSDTLESLP